MTTALVDALALEWLKFRHSTVGAVATGVLLVAVPGLTIWMVVGSGALRGELVDSPLGAKVAALLTTTGGPSLFEAGAEILSVATTVVVGIVLAWTVGREFVEGTVTSLFAQPVDRLAVVAAKVAVVLAWGVGCSVVAAGELALAAVAFGGGFDGLDGIGWPLARLVTVSILGVVLALPVAWVATVARSYLGAISALLGLVVVTQVITTAGVGRWWPWAAPSLWAGMGGPEARASVGALQLSLVVPVGVASLVALHRWWRRLELR